MSIHKIILQLTENKNFRKAFFKRDLGIELPQMLKEARFRKELSQEGLAKKMKTRQSAIARLESGRHMPNIAFLERMAKAYKTNLRIVFEFMDDWKPMSLQYQKGAQESIDWNKLYASSEQFPAVAMNSQALTQSQ